MKLRLKQKSLFGSVKSFHKVQIDKTEIIQATNENEEKVRIFFKGAKSSGILEFDKKEREIINFSR